MVLIAPALFVNHGGGARPLLGDKDHAKLIEFFTNDVKKLVNLKALKAIILVTAHWEEEVVTISSGKHHDLYYDYYGYPPEAYEYRYDAPGYPELANEIHEKLKESGIDSKLDDERGWDHGLFVPMLLINPAADIPIVQVSVLKNQDPRKHYQLGEALQMFRAQGIAIIGSGMTYHDFIKIKSHCYQDQVVNKEFDYYLNTVCTAGEESARREGLIAWKQQPGGIEAHPEGAAEHLMPLIVVAGAGGPRPAERVFNWDMLGTFRLSSFIWKDL
uniref:4,5-DOPA extradiol dioxygenase n=1 Tax=Bombyx mori TaxID=7091 RepID=A0A678W4F0_BOMMO|nr:4,5-DOPA extradiol dioxygenase [Bombyx mori]